MGLSDCEWGSRDDDTCGYPAKVETQYGGYWVNTRCVHSQTSVCMTEEEAIDEWEANQAALRRGPPKQLWIVRVLVRAFDALADRQAAWLADVDVDELNAELVRLRNENEGLKNANH